MQMKMIHMKVHLLGTWNHRSNIVDAPSLNCSNVVGGSGNGIGGGGWYSLGGNTCGNWQGVGERIAGIGNRSHSSNWSWCRFFMNIGFSCNFFMNIRLSSNFLMDIRKSLWNHLFFLRSWSTNSKGNKPESQK